MKKPIRTFEVYTKLKFVALCVAISLVTGCGHPNETSVAADYAKIYPDRTVVSAYPGEGDFSSVEFHVSYISGDSDVIHSEAWVYQKNRDGKWSVTMKIPDNR